MKNSVFDEQRKTNQVRDRSVQIQFNGEIYCISRDE